MQATIIGPMAQRTLSQPEKKLKLTVNSQERSVVAAADTPLLYVLRDQLELTGPRFGCGLGQCGACTVHLDGKPIRSCITPVGSAVGHKITTLEGLAATQPGNASNLHPVQQAWIDEQVPQCGFCQNGQIMTAKALLDKNSNPTDTQIREAMAKTLCRCMTYYRVQLAIKRAAKAIASLGSSRSKEVVA